MKIIYLDTQDYSRLYRSKIGSKEEEICNFLFKLINEEKIIIPASVTLISEILQPCDEKHFSDRIARARFLTSITRGCCLTYPYGDSDLSTPQLSNHWITSDSLHYFSFDALIEGFRQEIAKSNEISRHFRRKFTSTSIFKNEVLKHPNILSLFDAHVGQAPFLRHFVKGNYWRRYLKGEISSQEANSEFQKWLTDYEALFRLIHQNQDERDILQRVFYKFDSNLKNTFDQVLFEYKKMLDKYKENRINTKNMRDKIKSNDILSQSQKQILLSKAPKSPEINVEEILTEAVHKTLKNFPKYHEYLEICTAYLNSLLSGKKIRNSDFRDIVHALNIKSVDYWRGDREFSNTLVKFMPKYKEKISPTLSDLVVKLKSEFA